MLFSCLGLSLWAQKRLDFEALPACEYLMRIDQSGTHLQRSKSSELEPWLPARQFGWLVTHDSILTRFFEPSEGEIPMVNWERYFVLALIRYDYHPWRFAVEELIWEDDKTNIQLSYTLVPIGKRHREPLLSTQLILVEKNPDLQRLGITNIRFSLRETLDIDDPDIPLYGQHPDELIFPTAYTLEEIVKQ